MCRFTLYMGPAIRLSTLLIEPTHSLIRQSTHARERDEPLNGDGFGVGWYQPELTPEPVVFRSITPAWNNRNLHNLSRAISSPCILAHVRAASHTTGVNEANCHPFRFGRYLLMHNGDIGGFRAIRRALLESVGNQAFGNVYGSTDSEHFFALVIDELLATRESGDAVRRLARALARAIGRVLGLVEQHGDGTPSYLNVAVSDGDHAVVSRFCSDPELRPESLYTFSGSLYPPTASGTPKRRRNERARAVIVSSEQLTESPEWQEVPANHIVGFGRSGRPRLFACRPGGVREVGRAPLGSPVPLRRQDRLPA